jgi:outer membrane lipoprotein
MRRLLLLVLVCASVSGCASVFSGRMLQGVDRSLTVGVLRTDPARYRDARVVLAGEIIDTRPRTGGTEIEVLSRPLGDGDAPQRTDATDGRFIMVAPGFLDPAVYARGRRISMVGTVLGGEERALGDQPYRYILTRPDQIYLWPLPSPYAYPPPYPYLGYPYPFGQPYWPYYW